MRFSAASDVRCLFAVVDSPALSFRPRSLFSGSRCIFSASLLDLVSKSPGIRSQAHTHTSTSTGRTGQTKGRQQTTGGKKESGRKEEGLSHRIPFAGVGVPDRRESGRERLCRTRRPGSAGLTDCATDAVLVTDDRNSSSRTKRDD